MARHAGVGVGTVSRVINGSPLVSDETREKVLGAIEELDYAPNTFARRLSLGKTLTIGVIAPFFTRPSVVERLRGIDEVISESPYDLNIFNLETLDRRKRCIDDIVRTSKVDGLLIVSLILTADEVRRLEESRIKTVQIDATSDYCSQVAIDDIAGGRQATEHLIELGHRKIAFVSDFFDASLGNNSMEHRFLGYQQALKSAGIPFSTDYFSQGKHSRTVAYQQAQSLLRLVKPPTAIFASSDTQAIGIIEAAQDLDLDVPGDLSVIGYDDIELAEYLNLTTIRQPLHESGVRGCELLLDSLANERGAIRKIILPTEVIVRGTTRAPKG